MSILKAIKSLLLTFLLVTPSHLLSQAPTHTLGFADHIEGGYSGSGENVATYVTFPADIMNLYAGDSIVKVVVGMQEDIVDSSATLRIKSALKNKDGGDMRADILELKKVCLRSGWDTISLASPCPIADGNDLVVGFRFKKLSAAGIGYGTPHQSDADIAYSNQGWTTIGGSFCIKIILQGNAMPTDVVSVQQISSTSIRSYDTTGHALSFAVKNNGTNNVRSLAMSLSVDDAKSLYRTSTDIAPGVQDTINISLPTLPIGVHTISVGVDSVNNSPFALAEPLISTADIRDRRYMNRVVMEEGTGTWCKFCVTGIEAVEMLRSQHPEDFIPICIHSADPMEITDPDISYKQILNSFDGLPMCMVGRKFKGDPFGAGATYYNSVASQPALIGLSAQASWSSADSSSLRVACKVIVAEQTAAKFNLSYVIVEDSVVGYQQLNGYADGASGAFFGWENLPTYADVAFNHVARALYDEQAEQATFHMSMSPSQEYVSTRQIAVPMSVARKNKVRVIALLLDVDSGYIVNACEATPCGLFSPTALTTPQRCSDKNVTSVYDLQGRKVWRGLSSSCPKQFRRPLYILVNE